MCKYDVFLSYKHELNNDNVISNLYEQLTADKLNVWWDKKVLNNQNLYDQLTAGIDNSSTFVCCLTINYIASSNCIGELNYAFTLKKRILIVMFENIDIKDMKGVGFIINLYTRFNAYNEKNILNGIWPGPFYDNFLKCIKSNITETFHDYDSNLPQRDLKFISKNDLFKEIDNHFIDNEFLAIYSVAGSGKSSTAIEYAYRIKENCPNTIVWYILSETAEKLNMDLKNLVKTLDTNKENIDECKLCQELSILIENLPKNKFFFIFDNLENRSGIDDLLNSFNKINQKSALRKIQVIITTRNSLFFHDRKIMLRHTFFSEEDCFNFVKNKNFKNCQDSKIVKKLINSIKETNNSISPFKLERACNFLMNNPSISIDENSKTIRDYVEKELGILFFYDVMKLTDDVIEFLFFASLLDSDLINLAILGELSEAPFIEIEKTVQKLEELSFVELILENQTNVKGIKLEGMVRNLFWTEIDEKISKFLEVIIDYIEIKISKKCGKKSCQLNQEIQRHAISILREANLINTNKAKENKLCLSKDKIFSLLEVIDLAYLGDNYYDRILKWLTIEYEADQSNYRITDLIVKYLRVTCHHEKALDYLKISLELKQRAFPQNHAAIARNFNDIGDTYTSLSQNDKALYFFNKSLKIFEEIYHEPHQDIATVFNNMGILNDNLGQNQEALKYFKMSLDIYQQIYDKDHSAIATNLNNIGNIFCNLKQSNEALEYINKSLEIREKIYPQNHPDIAISLNNIGNIYESLGENEKALEYYEKSIQIKLAVYHEDHPTIAASFNNIGNVYKSLNNYKEALKYFDKSLIILNKNYTENHSDIATSINNIGTAYDNLEEYDKALEYYEKSLKIKQVIFNEDHPSIAISLNNIGSVYKHIGEYKKALDYYEKSLKIKKKIYPEDNPNIAISLKHIGFVYEILGQFDKALDNYEKSLSINRKCYSDDHPNVALDIKNIQDISYRHNHKNFFKKTVDLYRRIHLSPQPSLKKKLNNIEDIFDSFRKNNNKESHHLKNIFRHNSN